MCQIQELSVSICDWKLPGTGSYTGTATSAEIGPVTAVLSGIGAISGTPQVGNTLTAGALTPGGATATYQWQSGTSGGPYSDIDGAIESTYVPVDGNIGQYLVVEATGSGSYTGTATSDRDRAGNSGLTGNKKNLSPVFIFFMLIQFLLTD